MLEKDYPYTARDENCKFNKSKVAVEIKSYSGPVATCANIQAALSKQPISVGVDASNWSFYNGGTFSNCATNINHGVLLSGINSDGTWVIKNSWGAKWGNAGFITLAAGNTCAVCNKAAFPDL